jgi:cell division protein ZapA
LEDEIAALQDAREADADRSRSDQGAVAAALNAAAERIEDITKQLNQTVGPGIALG